MTNQDRVRVVLNAQINPKIAGGVESSALSIVRYYRQNPEDVALVALTESRFVEAMRAEAGADQSVHGWGGTQERPILATTDHPNIRLARRLAGLVGAHGWIDDGVRYWRRRELRLALREPVQNDAELASLGAEIVHFTSGPTFPTSLPFVYEPHDIQHRYFPEFFTPEEIAWRDRVYGGACRGAAMCVCGSEWTKSDIVRQFGVAPDRVAVVPRSSFNVEPAASNEAETEVVERLGLSQPFAYYPAMTFPHKNHVRLFEALARLRDERGIVVPLLLTGRWHKPTRSAVEAALDRYSLRDQVRHLGTVDSATLATLFRRARMVVFPSLFEGLSQSLLEAMQLGSPIVAARQTSIPETVGPGALFFDGLDVESIATTIGRGWQDPALLAASAETTKRYFERYDWKRAGPMLTAIYKFIGKRHLTDDDRALIEAATGSRP